MIHMLGLVRSNVNGTEKYLWQSDYSALNYSNWCTLDQCYYVTGQECVVLINDNFRFDMKWMMTWGTWYCDRKHTGLPNTQIHALCQKVPTNTKNSEYQERDDGSGELAEKEQVGLRNKRNPENYQEATNEKDAGDNGGYLQ